MEIKDYPVCRRQFAGTALLSLHPMGLQRQWPMRYGTICYRCDGRSLYLVAAITGLGRFRTMRMLLASMNTAFEAGRRTGVLREDSAIDCPIDHARLMSRLSWMHGFSKCRVDPRRDQDRIGLTVWQ